MRTWARITANLVLVLGMAVDPQMAVFLGQNVNPAGGGANTFTNVQRKDSGTACNGSATCAVTLTSTGSGNLLVVSAIYVDSSSQKTISSITAGACNVGWTIPGAAAAYESSLTGGGVALAFCPNSTSGNTTITTTMSAIPSGSLTVFVREYSFTGGGSVVQDFAGTRTQGTSVNPITGVTATLTGTSDLRVQCIATSGAAPTSVSTFTNLTTNGPGGDAELINTTTATAPSWTFAGNNGGAVGEIALK